MDTVKGMDLSHMFLMPEWAIGLSLDSKYLESTGDHFLQLSDTSTVLEELKTFYDKVTKGSMSIIIILLCNIL